MNRVIVSLFIFILALFVMQFIPQHDNSMMPVFIAALCGSAIGGLASYWGGVDAVEENKKNQQLAACRFLRNYLEYSINAISRLKNNKEISRNDSILKSLIYEDWCKDLLTTDLQDATGNFIVINTMSRLHQLQREWSRIEQQHDIIWNDYQGRISQARINQDEEAYKKACREVDYKNNEKRMSREIVCQEAIDLIDDIFRVRGILEEKEKSLS